MTVVHGSQYPSEATSSFHAPVPLCLPGGPEAVTPCEPFILQPSPKSTPAGLPRLKPSHLQLYCFFRSWMIRHTCYEQSWHVCWKAVLDEPPTQKKEKRKQQDDEKHTGIHRFHTDKVLRREWLIYSETKALMCTFTAVLFFLDTQRCLCDGWLHREWKVFAPVIRQWKPWLTMTP